LITLANFFQYANQGDTSIFQTNLMYIGFILTSVLFAIVWAQRHNEMKLKEVRADSLIKLNEAKTEFYSNITHEFRTPLTVIMGLASLIKDHPKEKELIQKNGQEVLNLVDQLLEISKSQSRTINFRPVDDNIIPYLEYLMEAFHSIAAQKNITLRFNPEEEEVIMAFDKEKIKLIFNNLVSNALKFTPDDGAVNVRAKTADKELILTISDTGVGISKQESDRIFDRYYQVKNNGNPAIPGSGIGLAMVKELVEFLQGSIRVESEKNTGTTFTVQLPLYLSNRETADNLQKEDLTGREGLCEPFENESIILVVEDNEDVLYYIQKIIGTTYKVLTAGDGEAGFKLAKKVIPDIIISDVMMPKMDGYALTKKLKEDPNTDHIPVILLTAKASQDEKVQGLAHGADAYLTKPFHEEELKLRINNLIENRQNLKVFFTEKDRPEKDMESQDPFLKKMLSVMEDHYADEDFGIGELIDALHLSRMQVHRKLKALTNLSTSQFINYFRLEKGKNFLKEGQLNISEVAYACGFSDPGYFSKLFGKKYGVNPISYRSERVL